MASKPTPALIRKMIETSNSADHYSYDEMLVLDGKPLDPKRSAATMAQITLDRYFFLNPDDSIVNYKD